MDWKGKMLTEDIQQIPKALKEKLVGTYDDFLYSQGVETKIIEKNNRLYVESMLVEHFKGKNDAELIYLKNGLFRIIDYPNLLQFEFDQGKPSVVILTRDNLTSKVPLMRSEK
jgi:hypothetical protein